MDLITEVLKYLNDKFKNIQVVQVGAMDGFSFDDKVFAINGIREQLKEHSPFSGEPVDCVAWVKADSVGANDYNPNSVAPPEMKLLEHSILEDGYTQPIVSWINNENYEKQNKS